jgi:glutamate synthase (NADPH) large chain
MNHKKTTGHDSEMEGPQRVGQQQGLYNPINEHDACGIGFVAHIKGKKSHDIVKQSITVLENLNHRGARGAEVNTGDGAGILFQIPHRFFSQVAEENGIVLPAPGEYGVGMGFLPRDPTIRAAIEKRIEGFITDEGLICLGWRSVPVDPTHLGDTARSAMPFIRQVFVGRGKAIRDEAQFERTLYIVRKRTENSITNQDESRPDYYYFASFSCRTIVYKGMLVADQVDAFYPDLSHPAVESAFALVHSRFSTNTFPSWERAHPYRYLIHNGEINTLRGNVNRMHARESHIKADLFGANSGKIFPIINANGSDSAMFDNTIEFLTLSGLPLEYAMMMMIPEPWSHDPSMDESKKAFYKYHACLMEPWDGPAAMAFTDGIRIGAVLDRNGLRPARYYVTDDDLVIMASEVGVLDIPANRIVKKDRLRPGRMLLIDTAQGRIIDDRELKETYARERPYAQWLAKNLLTLDDLPEAPVLPADDPADLLKRETAFGYTWEDIKTTLIPMATDGIEPTGSMGFDAPPAVLSEKPQLLYNYFKQLFAQVTNPPIDPLREEIVIGTEIFIGSEGDFLHPDETAARRVMVKHPILTNAELAKLRALDRPGFKTVTLSILFPVARNGEGLKKALDDLFDKADKAVADEASIIILSDRGVGKREAPIPALLAVSGLHHHLVEQETRTKVSLVLESGEPREVHHFASLIGYGVSAVNPYLAFEAIEDAAANGMMNGTTPEKAVANFVKAAYKGVVKTMTKMGISTIQAYQGAQIFEALGLSDSLVDTYFTGTATRIGGIGLKEIAEEAAVRHGKAYADRAGPIETLDEGGDWQWRKNGEFHLYNPQSVHALQQACRSGEYSLFKEYTKLIDDRSQNLHELRSLLRFKKGSPVPIEEVEPVSAIVKRFKTGAMSFGSISKEAHEALAIAMNRLGGKSNTGEGGEDPARFVPDANGDSRCSAIKQVASGRFGVTSHYLVNAKEIQIKMAQGAKPGEGGQLPGRKVYPWVAEVRHSTPGVGLISPPPHHDIYSIEDLGELIHDLKNANPDARISVKLVSEVGVGTVAAGVTKARADVVLVSGYDGGTGASPRSSIRHAGLPWELGLAETHQTLLLNNLRGRIVVETDGKLLSGRDVAIAALLGAEEFGFATGPLVSLGCVMMRVCNLDTCPVGVATQNPKLRARFKGDPQNVVNFMNFIASELREYMASLGFRTVDEMVGRSDLLEMDDELARGKTKNLDYSKILHLPEVPADWLRHHAAAQDHRLEDSLDRRVLLRVCEKAIERGDRVSLTLPIRNVNRVVGTILGSEVSKRYGAAGLPEDTIDLKFVGSAGQSFGAFIPRGITLGLEGDSNDYIGKGLSGGKIIVKPPREAGFVPEENILIGNVAFYGATSGEAYIRGIAGERFCVRNSGATAVVEGTGDHGCEYMTGGRVVVLGKTGRNFAAGMSGGVAYVYDADSSFASRLNGEMVDSSSLEPGTEAEDVRGMIRRHLKHTGSEVARAILDHWDESLARFVRVMPRDYSRMLAAIAKVTAEGLSGEAASMAAFEANYHDVSRVSGN